jgi:hypothetical protein
MPAKCNMKLLLRRPLKYGWEIVTFMITPAQTARNYCYVMKLTLHSANGTLLMSQFHRINVL